MAFARSLDTHGIQRPTEPLIYEAHLSTEQGTPQAHSWVPRTYGHEERPEGPGETPGEGPQEAHSLRTAPLQRLRLQPQRRIRRKSEFDAAYAHGQRLGNGFFAVTVYSRRQDSVAGSGLAHPELGHSGPDHSDSADPALGQSGAARRVPALSAPPDGGPRIGLAVAVRIAGGSVERNRIRRVIRESFRLHQHELPAVDLVVSARARARGASGPEMHAALAALWKKVAGICATSPPS